MNKEDLLKLETNAHLSIAELRKIEPALAKSIEERLEQRVTQTAIASLAGGSEKLLKVAETIKLPLGVKPNETGLREAMLQALRAQVGKDNQLKNDPELEAALVKLEALQEPTTAGYRPDVTLADLLHLNEPVALNPDFRRDLDAARIYRLSDAVGLGDNIAAVLIDHVGSVNGVTGDRLEALVESGVLNEKDSGDVGLAISLFHVLDERPELVAATKPGIEGVRDLVKQDSSAWAKIINDSKTKPPWGISADEYASVLTRKMEHLFPTDALAHRLTQVKVDDVLKEQTEFAALRKLNPGTGVVGIRDFDSLKTDGLADIAKLKEHYQGAVKFVNRYPGMRLAEVLDDEVLSDADKVSIVTRRADLAKDFFANNPDVLGADLTHGSDEVKTLEFAGGVSPDDKALLLANARAYQRAMTITEDLANAEALVVSGYRSALSVASSRLETLAAQTGLKPEIAARYQERAKAIASGVMAHMSTVIDVIQGGFNSIAVGNTSTELAGYLKEIPGFSDFFGNQDYCNCKHCQSILGPAAYFDDMMSFVDEHVTQPVFASQPDHPLNLKTRRPDLWTLELTCENTNKPIPYLVIINEILENAVATNAGFTGGFSNRVAVGTKVYKDTLEQSVVGLGQPLNLPFEELRTYLRHFERSLADVAEAGNATGDALARLRLALSPKDHQLITRVNLDMGFLKQVYGIEFQESAGAIQKFDAQKLLKPMGITRDELDELIATQFVEGTARIRIQGARRSANSLQNDIENIEGLTRAVLDRMHRFVRLWRATGWRIGELDLVLTHLLRVERVDRRKWSSDWTTAEFYTIGDTTYLFLLKEVDHPKDNGRVHIHRMNQDGTVGTWIEGLDWEAGWTTAKFYTIRDTTYLFLLKAGDGKVQFYRMNPNGTVGDKIGEQQWTSGWTTAEFYTIGDTTYLFLLKEVDHPKDNGRVHIHRMNQDGTVGTRIEGHDWETGWTTAKFYTIGGKTYLFSLKADGGMVHIHRMNEDGKIGDKIWETPSTGRWTSDWTTAEFYTIGDTTYLFLLKEVDRPKDNGRVHIHRMNQDGTVGTRIEEHDWATGWTTAKFHVIGDTTHLFLLSARDGRVLIYRMQADFSFRVDETTVQTVALLHRLQSRYDISLEELTALWSPLPQLAILRSAPGDTTAQGEGPSAYPRAASPLARLTTPLFDRLFNQPRFVEIDARYPQPGKKFLHPALVSTPPTDVDPNLHRLHAATGADNDGLRQLIEGLARPLGIDLKSSRDDEKVFALSVRNLSLLYRHARLARLLKIGIPELFALCNLAPEIGMDYVNGLSDLDALLKLHSWWKKTKWTLGEFVQMIQPDITTQEATTANDLAKELVEQVRQSRALEFADTVFAQLRPLAPVVTSGKALSTTAGGETVTYTPVVNGRSGSAETITLAKNASLEAVVADWNARATFTRAYRSNAAGNAIGSGTHLSITTKDGSGSATRLTITSDSDAIFTKKEAAGAEITLAQSRKLIDANAANLEKTSPEGRYRLKAGFDPSAAIKLPAGVDPAYMPLLRDTLRAHHSKAILLALLPDRAGVAPGVAAELLSMLGVNLDEDVYFRELRGDVASPEKIAGLMQPLRRLRTLFAQENVFDVDSLEFIRTNAPLFVIGDFSRLDLPGVRRIELFRRLIDAALNRNEPRPDIRSVLLAFTAKNPFTGADQEKLAALLGCDVGLVQSLQAHLSLSTKRFEALEELSAAAELAQAVGIGGSALQRAQSTKYDDLTAASTELMAAFRAKYKDEAEWERTVEPFNDALLSRRRDGLVAYLIHSGAPRFDEVTDLYRHYLLDVEIDGCMRTSRVAAAIDSVQLYVHRCRMNLEETAPGDPNPVHVLPEHIPNAEWDWRKNYRVWEANRKIFLYPENYIEPGLRDDKTPLFKTLEEELLSKEITTEAMLEAYGRYLRGFDELAHLTIAGSYHEKDTTARRDVLHLFGVTSDDPPVYYYRRVEDAHYGAVSDERATHWGAWEKLTIQVPVRKVAPIVHNSQLYVFWIRYVTKAQNEVKDGTSRFIGYQHKAYVEFARRKLDGSWTTPQRLRLNSAPFGPDSFPQSFQDDGVILDPIVPKEIGKKEILWWYWIPTYTDYEPLYDSRTHEVPREDYTLSGFQWDQLYPESKDKIFLRGINFQMWSHVDLYRLQIGPQIVVAVDNDLRALAGGQPKDKDRGVVDDGVPWIHPGILMFLHFLGGESFLRSVLPPRKLVWSRITGEGRELHSTPSGYPVFDPYSYASLLLDEARFKQYEQRLAATESTTGRRDAWTAPQWLHEVTDYLASVLKPNHIATIPSDASIDVVNGSVGDVVIQTSRDVFYLQTEVRSDGKYHLRRLNTSLSEDIAALLFKQGLDELLSTKTQLGLKEHPTGLTIVASKINRATKTGRIDFNGPMGAYLREVFFHIPFLIANHLNSQGRYEDAQRWYHYIFDPTASESITGLPAGLSEEERRRREHDRNWRYREFRGLTLDSLHAQLTNQAAIEQYKRNPFNPHAIARLRTSAYQKAIVMKYVDNLLDWGDELFSRAFAERNQEYLREATLKYVTAQEILGDRPAQLGHCGDGGLAPKVFTAIIARPADDFQFPMELESTVATRSRLGASAKTQDKRIAVSADSVALGIKLPYADAKGVDALPTAFQGSATLVPLAIAGSTPEARDGSVTVANPYNLSGTSRTEEVFSWAWSFVRQVGPIFCVPGNERMLRYWDRVEDRLYKLRHCQDIDGVFRLLPLFAPEIDPGLLTGGKATGLSLEDILSASTGSIPPYRFHYLIEKAKGFAATVQSFGAALLSALEKRDAEELAKLRNVHQKNLLSLSVEVRKNELKIAEENAEIVRRRQAAAKYRKDYYAGQISTGLIAAEATQSNAQLESLAHRDLQAVLAIYTSIAYLFPQLGSPFALTYGGQETGSSGDAFYKLFGAMAQAADITSSRAGIIAGQERRVQEWNHQKQLAEHDLKSIERELIVAELSKAIATRSLELHDREREQHDEIMEFFADKFSNLGLYTYLSGSLQHLHKEAYNNALAMARLAEHAYRFERPGDTTTTPFVGGEWDASRSGLLAGERLLMALHNMEKRFVESYARQAEINQSFSLAQIDPQALVLLKETGDCEFAIPEFYFDMFYPGQYRRRIQAVRLTIPCVVGPYTNVSAKLTLLESSIRREAALGADGLIVVPATRTSSVATSNGQADAGVFELNFRDERYMPFEGAGAVSKWKIELPSRFRPFDYQSISDVVLNISYTAEDDQNLREEVETDIDTEVGALLHYLKNNSLTRVFSLRQEFFSAFNRLVKEAAGTPVTIDITDRHFPLFLQGLDLAVEDATLVLVIEEPNQVEDVKMSVNGEEVKLEPDDAYGGLPAKQLADAKGGDIKQRYTIMVKEGSLSTARTLRDILIVVKLQS